MRLLPLPFKALNVFFYELCTALHFNNFEVSRGFHSVQLSGFNQCDVATTHGALYVINHQFTFAVYEGPKFIAVVVNLITDVL